MVVEPLKKTAVQEAQRLNSLSGKGSDGSSPTARYRPRPLSIRSTRTAALRVDGPQKGATATEKSYAAVKVNDKTWVVSYLAASGHTLTVVLNQDDGKAIGFGQNDKSWTPLTGTLNFVN